MISLSTRWPASGKKVPACVSSSVRSTEHLERLGFKVLDPNEVDEIEVYVDGADEIDSGFHMVKGGGGALTREKILASLARTYVALPMKASSCGVRQIPAAG